LVSESSWWVVSLFGWPTSVERNTIGGGREVGHLLMAKGTEL